ncbi:MAG: hypothetical protein NC453_17035 [Muribaculum sp.]|nr:hypothetical protein [Muribaculum sp.]
MEEMSKKLSFCDLMNFTILTLIISSASSIGNNEIFRTITLLIFVIQNLKIKKKVITKEVVLIALVWISINMIAILVTNSNVFYLQIGGFLVNIYIAYYLLRYYSDLFWPKYEKYLYRLCIISFFIYIFSISFPGLITQLSSYFRWFTDDIYFRKSTQQNYCYMFFFVSTGRDILRNSGFMWEPGAYALILTILISLNIARENERDWRKIIVYLIILVTTFSTAGYISILMFAITYLVRSKAVINKVVIGLIGSIVILYVLDLEWLMPKINNYIYDYQNETVYEQGITTYKEANRLLSAKYLIGKSLQLPLGWGVAEDKISYLATNEIVTVNGLFSLLCIWGWPCFLYAMKNIYVFYEGFSPKNFQSKRAVIACLFIANIIVLFSNPVERNPIIYLLIFTPLVIKSSKFYNIKVR